MRNMIKKIRVLALMLMCMLCSNTVTAFAELPFKDVSSSSWYYKAIESAYKSNLFFGTAEDAFSPDASMTRGMFVQVLANKTRNYDRSNYSLKPFLDTQKEHWYTPAIQWGVEYGIISGVGNGLFRPERPITREQAAVLLYRYAQKTGSSISYSGYWYNVYRDNDKVSPWAIEAMKWATDKKIFNGAHDRLNPQGIASRAEVAQIFANAEYIITTDEIGLYRPLLTDLRPESFSYEDFRGLYSSRTIERDANNLVIRLFPNEYNRRLSSNVFAVFFQAIDETVMKNYLKNLSDACITDYNFFDIDDKEITVQFFYSLTGKEGFTVKKIGEKNIYIGKS